MRKANGFISTFNLNFPRCCGVLVRGVSALREQPTPRLNMYERGTSDSLSKNPHAFYGDFQKSSV
jgi:hypothetical protein